MKLLAAAVIAALLTGCGTAARPDLSGLPDYQRVGILDAVSEGDCQKMQAAFDHVDDADVLTWIDAQMRDADCY